MVDIKPTKQTAKHNSTWRNNKVWEARVVMKLDRFLILESFHDENVLFLQCLSQGRDLNHLIVLLEVALEDLQSLLNWI